MAKCERCNYDAPLYKHEDLDEKLCADCLMEIMAKHYPEITPVSDFR